MKDYSYKDSPIEVCGLPFFKENGKLERVKADSREKIPSIEYYGRRCPGARLRFRTNSTVISVKFIFEESIHVDSCMSIAAAQSGNLYIGAGKNARFAGLIRPQDGYASDTASITAKKSGDTEDILILFPRNEVVKDVIISLDDDALIEPPTPYKHTKPIMYYGSSITEGGCCSRVANTYTALLSVWLDSDYYNYGFSCSAKGELDMADCINGIDMSVFVLDYDHNAPNAEFLEATHEPFFKRIREKHPDLPIVIMTRPDFDYSETCAKRREVIKKTYQNAVANGDKNVYFIDGQTFFGDEDRHACTVDACHPNDLGAYRMAKTVFPLLKTLLK